MVMLSLKFLHVLLGEMIDRSRNKDSGRFTQKSDQKRKVRSLRLTDKTYNYLKEKALKNDQTIADLIEQIVEDKLLEKDTERYIVYMSEFYKRTKNPTVILKVSQLANRLSVKSRTVSNYISKGSDFFSSWTKTRDPDDISWKSLDKKLGYIPAIDLTPEQKENLNKWVDEKLLKVE